MSRFVGVKSAPPEDGVVPPSWGEFGFFLLDFVRSGLGLESQVSIGAIYDKGQIGESARVR